MTNQTDNSAKNTELYNKVNEFVRTLEGVSESSYSDPQFPETYAFSVLVSVREQFCPTDFNSSEENDIWFRSLREKLVQNLGVEPASVMRINFNQVIFTLDDVRVELCFLEE